MINACSILTLPNIPDSLSSLTVDDLEARHVLELRQSVNQSVAS